MSVLNLTSEQLTQTLINHAELWLSGIVLASQVRDSVYDSCHSKIVTCERQNSATDNDFTYRETDLYLDAVQYVSTCLETFNGDGV